jgi:biopolymer transport protein ExbD
VAASTEERAGRAITGINVTPMVDVVLVLLIIFMATAPLIHRRALNVNVPQSAHGESKATATLQITFTAEREIYVEKAKYPLDKLEPELRLRLRLDPALHVSVAADESLPYGEVVKMLDLVRGAGVKKVALEVKAK